MLNRSSSPIALEPCWYTRRHVPQGRRKREEDGAVTCTCRHCGRKIRSRERGQWDLAEGFDLEALQERSRTGHFCVVDVLDGLVVARYPILMDADETWIQERLAQIREEHAIGEAGSDLQIRLVPGQRETRLRH